MRWEWDDLDLQGEQNNTIIRITVKFDGRVVVTEKNSSQSVASNPPPNTKSSPQYKRKSVWELCVSFFE